jgi:hypothetical protein
MFRELAAVAAAAAVVCACAHEPGGGKSDPYVTQSVAAITGWLVGLPRCPPASALDETPSFRREDGTDAIAVRGHFTLAAHPECTAMKCGAAECCNTCFPHWIVVPDAVDAPLRALAIQKSDANKPLSAVMKDCKLDPVRQQLPPTRVSVSGFLEGETIIRASLCVIEPPPAPAAK